MPEQKSKNGLIWGIIIVVVIIIIAVVAKGGGSKNDTIRVGIIAPLTGTASAYGIEGSNSVKLALDEINAAGGINGKKIEYTLEDGKCDTKAALDAWNKLVSIDKVQAVFGGHCSTESIAIAPLSAKDKVPVFAVFATAPTMANEGEWFFRHVSTNAFYATALADQAYARGYRKTALITEQKDFPISYSDAYIAEFKKLGGQVVLDERFAPGTTDYRSMALKLKNLGYDSVFISAQGPDTMALISLQIKDLGLEKAALFNHAFSYAKFTQTTHGYMPKEYLMVQPFTDPNSSKVKGFNDKYVAKFGSLYNFNRFFITADYDIVNRFKLAAAQCMTGTESSLNIDCVRDQFKAATSYSGVAGDVVISSKFSPHGVLTPIANVNIVDGKEVLTEIK